ncbi:MAG: DNA topoisomerase IB [Gaiellaceae bacterium]|jgi:DNA topoisomerase-1
MPSRLTWTRKGTRRPFRYFDAQGNRIRDPAVIARLDALAIPPAWKDVRIAPTPRAKLQAVGTDGAGRRQYRYHPDFRAQQEAAKYDELIRFAEKLPDLRLAMGEHLTRDPLDPLHVCAVAIRLINLAWFRVGSDRHTKRSRTYGVTTLNKSHVKVRGTRVTFRFRAKGKVQVRTAVVDVELADSIRALLATPGRRLFRYEVEGGLSNLTNRRLNDYVREYMGGDFSCKDFRTWGGTLTAAIAFAERGPVEGKTEQKRVVAAVMRTVADRLGNTPAVARASYVSPAVVDQYLDGRTIDDFRPRHLRIVTARDIGLDQEEQATLSLLRSWRIRESRKAA